MEKYVIDYTKETGLIFRSLGDNLIYSDEEMTQKINNLKAKEIIVHYNSSDSNFFYNLELTEYPLVSNNTRKIKEITIKSNNRVIMTIYNTERVKFPIWFDNLSKLVKEDYGEICKEVKEFLIKYPNIINYTDNQLDEMIKKEKLKRSDESKLKILEVKKQTIKDIACSLYDYDSNQINNEVQNICSTYNDEVLTKIIQAINCDRKDINIEILKAIFKLLVIEGGVIFLKKLSNLIFLPTPAFILIASFSGFMTYMCKKDFYISNFLLSFLSKINQSKKLKKELKLIKKQMKKKTMLQNNALNDNELNISKENSKEKKDTFLESLKECICKMKENPNIDWTLEKKKVMILAEGYTKIKKASSLDSVTLLQAYPDFISELCDLETSIKNKILANNKDTAYDEDLEEVATLLDDIKTPEMTLKLAK